MLGRLLPFGECRLCPPGLHPVMREDFWMVLLKCRELSADRLCYQPVQVFALTLEQCFVGSVADECMLEQIGGMWNSAICVKQLRVGQDSKSALQILFG